MNPEESIGYNVRTYSLKSKNGVYAWIYNDGTERFPGVVFTNPEAAKQHIDEKSRTRYTHIEYAR